MSEMKRMRNLGGMDGVISNVGDLPAQAGKSGWDFLPAMPCGR